MDNSSASLRIRKFDTIFVAVEGLGFGGTGDVSFDLFCLQKDLTASFFLNQKNYPNLSPDVSETIHLDRKRILSLIDIHYYEIQMEPMAVQPDLTPSLTVAPPLMSQDGNGVASLFIKGPHSQHNSIVFRLDFLLGFRFPPYTKKKEDDLRRMGLPKIPYARPGTQASSGWYRWLGLFGLVGAVAAVVTNRRLPVKNGTGTA